MSKTILFMSAFEPNLKFIISEEINSLLDSKNMIYKTILKINQFLNYYTIYIVFFF